MAFHTLDGNEAVASVAYRLSETIAIYPITPASVMGEHADDWAVLGKPNLWGQVPGVVEMQSEAGAAGAMHGALQAGSLVTTFTASQGLLLMLPNLFKIAGELSPFCMHVAARSVATHALSIFCDHSDVMCARGTGFALLASGSVQEAQDLAAIGHAVTLESRIPVMHFFDGFRTSHEIDKIVALSDEDLQALVSHQAVEAHRNRRMTPDRPVVRGTSQNPDAFFQSREATNPFYQAFPERLEAVMGRFAEITGRHYRLFDYVGHPQAERVVILMGSGAECAHETVEWLMAQEEKVGVLKVRLFRPFATDRFLQALPDTVKHLAVLDRTKEPGAQGEPLLLEVSAGLMEAYSRGEREILPRLIGGRYGLSSREFTPAMVCAVFAQLEEPSAKTRFTVGVRDDVTHLSLDVDSELDIESPQTRRALFFGLGADGTVSSNKSSIRILGEGTDLFAQGHFVYDSKKSGATTVSHLRFGPLPIRSSYQIRQAQFVAVHAPQFLERFDILEHAAPGATVLLNVPWPADQVWDRLSVEAQRVLVERKARLFVIDAAEVAEKAGLERRINTVMQVCFFALADILPRDEAIARIKESIRQTWGRRGPEVVRRNVEAVDSALANLHEVTVPGEVTATHTRPSRVPVDAPDFVQKVTRLLMDGQGDRLPVSAFPADGTWPTGTSQYEKRGIALEIPVWEPDLCVQCNFCTMICPHTAIISKVFEPEAGKGAPSSFEAVPETHTPELEGLDYRLQVAPEDCTGCGLCVEVCPAKDRTRPKRKAINMQPLEEHREAEAENLAFLRSLPDVPRNRIPRDFKSLPLLIPLFEYSGACSGCGETPYIRLLTQLLGDRLLIANATGCSSIYGGNLPTTPYTVNADGRGPTWNNSLFEDAAELGLGMRMGLNKLVGRARQLLEDMKASLSPELYRRLTRPCTTLDETAMAQRREAVSELRDWLGDQQGPGAQELASLADELCPKSVWVIGGDGWAYDIGYGGLDHALASGQNLKLLVLDTEVYSNTGGQQSKATPMGAVAKFAAAGKETRKKDLGLLAMSYGHVYVAQIAMQSHSNQTTKALQEAESFDGPALIIAHSPCIAHGYDLVHSPAQQRRAVDSWAWPLYRFDPRRIHEGLPPLQLDSVRQKVPMKTYMQEEARFRMLELRDPERYEQLVAAASEAAKEQRELYMQLAGIHFEAHEYPESDHKEGDRHD
ncbi:pyruvate:ferredoxin (flavodoxin) oxidoreductase [Marinobacter orientalis]|uniref:Pyruvate-flavodoxin oxidoreductase n=1 Tax=Marinobacter orientalis TaxID=1928859 RepID=A0A7Y0NKE1_9GAMM|nr:pyruvate:ferredoxin (flavodoxin) oxidoreductase [Marinobacter orientalis]NMT62517.1 pyruvate:ferredoxin (flavodoxin) oxidoreductase [Marinobacter orientalis]TGX51212.1 pyruvate:ferredoxin (flavodoxin) oxidoreductase [Marinobacter orientalis]